MSKVVSFFGHISPNFLTTFFRDPQIFFFDQYFFSHIPNKASRVYYFFTLLDLKNYSLDFIDLKTVFRPKKPVFKPKKIF